jgi:hypothetical protein
MDQAAEKIMEAALDRQTPYPSPESVVASILADGRTAGSDGVPRIGRATRKKAQQACDALRAAGWRIIR